MPIDGLPAEVNLPAEYWGVDVLARLREADGLRAEVERLKKLVELSGQTAAPARSAAEQRVLDAMAAVGRGRLRHIIEAEISSLSEAAEAELARREGKP